MVRYVVCRSAAMPPGDVNNTLDTELRSIGIFNINGTFYAHAKYLPACQGATLCRGIITGLLVSDEPLQMQITRDGEIAALSMAWMGI